MRTETSLKQGEKESRLERQAFFLLKAVHKAQRVYRLFDTGDHIALAISGGKDSAAMAALLSRWEGVPKLTLSAIHVTVSEEGCTAGIDPEVLRSWLGDHGIRLTDAPMDPPSRDRGRKRQGPCFHCAWRRRKALFTAAHRLGCNKVALAHHADDVAATTLLNLVHGGRCETMAPRQELFAGALTLIRPLFLVEERDIVRLVRSGLLPFAPAICGHGGDSRRSRMREVLRMLERDNPRTKRSLLNAVECCAGKGAEGV